ncbi:MAG: hypothetical protein ACLTTH_14915 [Holdemanella porci]
MNLNDYVKFDDSRKQFEILTGTQGKYSYDDVIRVSVLNEKAKYKEREFHLQLYFQVDHYHLAYYRIHIYMLE